MSFIAPPPLEGVLVLDLSRVLAGPFATMMLADMGAVVIKIEEPARGDDTRGFGPPFVNGESTYFMSCNRNKWSLAVDLKSDEGRSLVTDLALQADIVVENFRPGTAARMGLGYDDLVKRKPELIYVSISGFGQTGPERERAGYDVLAQGMGGVMSVTGPKDGQPYKVGVSQADLVAGMYAVQGALLALISRSRTGRGQLVDVSLLDGQVSLLSFLGTAWLNAGREPARHGNQHASIAPYQSYETADGRICVAVGNDALFVTLSRELGRPELSEDVRFSTNRARVENVMALNEVLEPLFLTRTTAAWIELLDGAGIPAGPIRTVSEVFDSEQVQARGMVCHLDHPTVGPVRLIGNPIHLSATPPRYELAPPLLGQHSEQVLRIVLKMSDDEIAGLRDRGVIRQWSDEHEATPPEPASALGEGREAEVGQASARSEADGEGVPTDGGAQ